MLSKFDEILYRRAARWIRSNPEDKRLPDKIKQDFLSFSTLLPEDKIQLVATLNALLKTAGLPETIEQSLPGLTSDLDTLPDKSHSRGMYSFFQPTNLLDKFLQCVAFGQQDKVEELFTNEYQNNVEKIQKALLHQERFTDYSGRTFNCTAYEYAYWAKDTNMCRMLERYMDEATKEQMLARINETERVDEITNQPIGLKYQQNDVDHCSSHFDLTPLIQALQAYVDGYDGWSSTQNWDALHAAWLAVGLAQRDVPAHVAHEYCMTERPFHPCPQFNQPLLTRDLTFHNRITRRAEEWFPLASPPSGLGIDFALTLGRGNWNDVPIGISGVMFDHPEGSMVQMDLIAITHLNEVRIADLTLSREHLNPPALSQSMNT